jgi:hypothetical protein
VIEGTDFVARADRLTYKSTTDRLILEGNGRTPAEILRQARPGARPEKTAAGRISYWPKTQRIQIDDFRSLDFSMLQANDEAESAPPPQPAAPLPPAGLPPVGPRSPRRPGSGTFRPPAAFPPGGVPPVGRPALPARK